MPDPVIQEAEVVYQELVDPLTTCSYCEDKHPKSKMVWSGRRWLCPYCMEAAGKL